MDRADGTPRAWKSVPSAGLAWGLDHLVRSRLLWVCCCHGYVHATDFVGCGLVVRVGARGLFSGLPWPPQLSTALHVCFTGGSLYSSYPPEDRWIFVCALPPQQFSLLLIQQSGKHVGLVPARELLMASRPPVTHLSSCPVPTLPSLQPVGAHGREPASGCKLPSFVGPLAFPNCHTN